MESSGRRFVHVDGSLNRYLKRKGDPPMIDKSIKLKAEQRVLSVLNQFLDSMDTITTNLSVEESNSMDKIEDLLSDTTLNFNEVMRNNIGDILSCVNETALIEKTKIKYHDVGIPLYQHRKAEKRIMTVHGPISYLRTELIVPRNAKVAWAHVNAYRGIIPLDRALGVSYLPHRLTQKAMLLCANIAVDSNSYQEAHNTLKDYLGLQISADVIRRVTNKVGAIQFATELAYAKTIESSMEKVLQDIQLNRVEDITYIMPDGSYVWSIINGDTDVEYTLVSDKKLEYKEVKLAAVFKQSDVEIYLSKKGEKCYKIKKVMLVPYLGEVEQFNKLLYASCYKYGYLYSSKTIVLADGAPWITNFVEEYIPSAIRILDLFHLIENINKYAKALYPNNDKARKYFADTVIDFLKQGEKDKAIELVLNRSLNFERPSDCVDLYKYLTDNYLHIDYKKYLEEGYFVGSGLIESRNKSFVQRRMKQPGMRWYPANVNRVLTIKAKKANGHWPEVEDNLAKYFEHMHKIRTG